MIVEEQNQLKRSVKKARKVRIRPFTNIVSQCDSSNDSDGGGFESGKLKIFL